MSADAAQAKPIDGTPAVPAGIFLKRLELQGFKSFADHTVLEFGPGLSAVVGPNGSGKSNLSEAFRWVLGEHSARQLRGTRMEDIIFAGSAQRRPVGLARVTIVLTNDGSLPVPYKEVSISRRVDRSGQSQFLLNGTPCRLKDIQQLLHDTGLGREAYSVVGQGQVDQVLSSRSEDRRVLVEEVAGIVRFKERRREALRRLARVEQRLERLSDILTDLQSHIEPLREQAEEARRYRSLQSRLQRLELQIKVSRLADLQAQWEQGQKELAAAREKLTGKREAETALTRRVGQGRQRLTGLEEQINELQGQLDELAPRLEESRAAVRLGQADEERLADEARRLAAAEADLARQLAQLGHQDQGDHAQAEALAAQVARKEKQLAQAEEAVAAWRQGRQKQERRREELARRAMDFLQQEGRVQNRLARLTVQEEESRRRQKEAETEGQAAGGRWQRLRAQVEQGREELAAAEKAWQAAGQAQARAAQTYRELQDALQAAGRRRQQAEQTLAAAASRRRLLEDMQRAYEGYGQGVRSVMQGRQQGNPAFDDVIGTAAELLTIPARYELALEAALGAAAQNLITRTGSGAQRAVAQLKKQRGGRATFLPLDALAANLPPAGDQALAALPGIIDWALNLVEFAPEHRRAVVHLLGRTLVAEDLAAARQAARQSHFRYRIVTLAGDLVHAGGAITGGSRPGSGRRMELLARSRMVAEAQKEQRQGEEELAAAQQAFQQAEDRLAAGQTALEAARAKEHEKQQVVLRLGRELEAYRAQQEQARQAADRAAATAADMARQSGRIQAERAAAAAEAERLASQKEATEKQLAALTEQAARADDEGRRLEEERGQCRLELAGARQSLDGLLTMQKRSREQRHRLETALAEQRQRQKDVAARRRQGAADLAAARKQVEQLTADQQQLRSAMAEKREQRRATAEQVARWEERLAEGRQAVEAAREEVHRLEVEASRLAARHEQAQDELQQHVGQVNPHAPGEGTIHGLEPLSPAELRRSRREVNDLRRQLAAMGEVNLAAQRQLSQLVGREAFLSHQIEDLTAAAQGLHTAIGLLEERMEVLFMEAFGQLRRRFNVVFQKLFGGGRADLTLDAAQAVGAAGKEESGEAAQAAPDGPDGPEESSDGPMSAGIEIVAQPPGKRLQPLPLLSGGERALTAIALLFALLEVRPTPFCVLDEIDTALDEINQRRFAGYLTQLSDKVQFIVITHRKITMTAADYLYGVTMGEAGVSQLVAVKMADAAAGTEGGNIGVG